MVMTFDVMIDTKWSEAGKMRFEKCLEACHLCPWSNIIIEKSKVKNAIFLGRTANTYNVNQEVILII